MILTLEEAHKVNDKITQDDLDGIEIAIRTLTNNKFQVPATKSKVLSISNNAVKLAETPRGYRVGDTVEIYDDGLNDGLYVITGVDKNVLTFADDLFGGLPTGELPTVVKIVYPADVKAGVMKLLNYDAVMGDKVGIKSETISRMSTTYYDVNASDNINGYPAAMFDFVNKYRKVRW